MHKHEELLHKFYTAFSNLDYKFMQECYAFNATFDDEVFPNLNTKQVCAMWEMLCKNAKDLHLEFTITPVDEMAWRVSWTARYTFSKTGRKVVNNVRAYFVFENGKIVFHEDRFDFHKWAGQALGLTGKIFGGMFWMRKKVQKQARESLERFMSKKETA